MGSIDPHRIAADSPRPAAQTTLQAFAPHVATALELRQQAEPGWLERLHNWTLRGTPGRKWAVGAAVALVLLLPLTPWRFRVSTECQVEPVVRRFCVAPYAGILKTSLVQPGDIVADNQPLARMDDRELRWELSSTMAERGRARTKRDQAMDDHDTSEAKLAELEVERLDLKIQLFKNREQQLEIASPLVGVVLKGNLEDAEGAPVKAGQTLFEIAPLHPIKLELAIPEEDLPSVRDGQSITAHLDGYRGGSIRGTIGKIHPRSEIRDSQNIFVAEVELDNPASALRPGMSGRAKIAAGFRPLGWIWFHKAWHRTRTFFGV